MFSLENADGRVWPRVCIKEFRLHPLPHQKDLNVEDVGGPLPKEPRKITGDNKLLITIGTRRQQSQT